MALTEENGGGTGMVMPVAPMQGGGYGNYGGSGGGWGGDGWWIILLFLFAFGGGRGYGFGGNGGPGGFAADGAAVYPWMNQAEVTQNGFRDQMINANVSSIRDGLNDISTQLCNGFGGVQTSLCNGFAGVNATVNSGFANAETAANARQMANMNQAFNAQTAMMQGFNQLGSQFADYCCENRLANCQTQNIIQNEGNATRFADANNTRDLLTAFNSGIQSIKDQLCEYRNDQKDETIANLRQELMFSRGQASQVEQTAQLLSNNNAQTALFQQGLNDEVDALYNRLNNCPVPTTPVYGRTPIFTCNNNGCGCGCGCGGNGFAN